ncbi:MAG: hypothetical protein KJ749_06445 [Planctomycetes bacterium]|nr:hypothetical protein [Planctomycetota bacterium]MBU1985514.1 hypothetical protein [bacterium]
MLIIILTGVGGSLAWFLYVLREEPPRRAVAALPPVVESAVVWAEDVAERYSGYVAVVIPLVPPGRREPSRNISNSPCDERLGAS